MSRMHHCALRFKRAVGESFFTRVHACALLATSDDSYSSLMLDASMLCL
jgi:hypothetical protein